MKIAFIIYLILLINYGNSQNRYNLSSENFQFHLVFQDGNYEIQYSHNLIDSGWNIMEKGRVKKRNKILILRTSYPTKTSLIKMKLLNVDCSCQSIYPLFISIDGNECLEIIEIKNKEFIKKIFNK